MPFLLFSLLYGCAEVETQPIAEGDYADLCVYTAKYSADSLRTIFPFNRAHKVQLVSFENNMEEDSSGRINIESFIRMYFSRGKDSVMVRDSSFIQNLEWKESVYLSEQAQRELADIIFNYTRKAARETEITGACYWPRNGIIFYDSLNKAYAGYEICFECSGIVTHPYDMSYGDKCDEKMKMIQDFFVSNGIKYVREH